MVASVLSLTPLVALATPGHAISGSATADGSSSTYIVQVDPGTADVVADKIAGLGASPGAEFTQALDGFAVDLTTAQAQALEASPGSTSRRCPGRPVLLPDQRRCLRIRLRGRHGCRSAPWPGCAPSPRVYRSSRRQGRPDRAGAGAVLPGRHAERTAVADAITASSEYRTGLIRESYQTYLGREPEPAGLQNWLDAMNQGLTIQQMQAGWVGKLYASVLGRTAAPDEVSAWTAAISGGWSRVEIALGFLISSEHLSTVIDGSYQHLLGRGVDPTGQAGWVGAIQQGTRLEAVIGSIVASPEHYSKNT